MPAKTEEAKKEAFSLTDWLVEGIEGVAEKGKEMEFIPAEFRSHVKAAQRESLLALRSLLDSAITTLEEQEPEPKKVTKIKVE
jgi:hypothetical protein